MVALGLLLGACEVKFSLPAYQPVTTVEMRGAIAVSDFRYTPPKDTIKSNQIRETAAGTIYMTEDVGTYFANAVRRELRQTGLSLQTDKCTLTGTVHDFAMESLGFSSDYITDVEYRLRGAGEHVGRYTVKFNTTKFLEAHLIMANIQKSVSDNVGQLLADPAFRAAAAKCR